MELPESVPRSTTADMGRAGLARTPVIAWLAAALALPAGAFWLADAEGSSLSLPLASASLTFAIVAALSWLWRREQAVHPSPWSEYLAVGYSAMFHIPALMQAADIGDRLIDWLLLFAPPVSVVALLTRRALTGRMTDPDRRRRRGQRVHLVASAVFGMAALFLVLTIIGIVVAPIPLIGASLHYHASRFYRT